MASSSIRSAFHGALAACGRCAVCERWPRPNLCGDCLHRYATHLPRCLQCAIELPLGDALPSGLRCGACMQRPALIEHTVAALRYGYPWDGLIGRFKFNGATDLAAPLSGLLIGAARHARDHDGLPWPDLLLPAPLTPERLRERGYNQAWELTRRVGRQLRLRIAPDVLARVRGGAHQADLPREQRFQQVRGAYVPTPQGLKLLPGRRVAVVDDVMTTGATAQELAQTLLRAGAAAVQVWVLARTPDD